ncbi:hypothetical protein NOR_02792 [Metarhizium rileyi]|uniref:Uncharacterized protein n=1 Tax=Metarhizium rileyi (strain RCEF 4871) TaxID=1649241 RepID=A0A167GVH5_METRR|nr:hypothetical protein NOR_02792 [Metarhizium rileyi RCEF 4871]
MQLQSLTYTVLGLSGLVLGLPCVSPQKDTPSPQTMPTKAAPAVDAVELPAPSSVASHDTTATPAVAVGEPRKEGSLQGEEAAETKQRGDTDDVKDVDDGENSSSTNNKPAAGHEDCYPWELRQKHPFKLPAYGTKLCPPPASYRPEPLENLGQWKNGVKCYTEEDVGRTLTPEGGLAFPNLTRC